LEVSELVIVNASPLVFLGNAGRLELLRAVGSSRILVPQAVFDEVTSSKHCDRASAAVQEASWIERSAVSTIPMSVAAWDLGAGESEVIAMGLSNRHARLVIDDLAGRKCGLAHGLGVVGTLGVVVAAHRRGMVEDPASIFAELRAAGMWLSDALLARVLKQATGSE
jgi:predicted nucleic acid-binding protein